MAVRVPMSVGKLKEDYDKSFIYLESQFKILNKL